MRKSFLITFVASLLWACEKPIDPVANIVENLKTPESIHYKAIEKSWYSNEPDTTVTPYEVWAIRDEGDTVKGGYVWLDNNYRPYNMIYDRGDFYLAIPPKNTTVLFKDFNESFISETDWIDYFLKPDNFSDLFSDAGISTSITDTLINDKEYVKIFADFPEENGWKKKRYVFVLDKNSSAPVWSEMVLETKHYTYHDVISFSGFETNSVNITALKERQKKVLAANPVERSGDNSELSRLEKMLNVGDKAPLFFGKYYTNGKNFKLAEHIGKNVIIIDFWYTHCHPCVMAMPHLNELYLKYKDKGLKVFGLNSVDNQPRSMDNLKRFLSKRDIDYDIILAKPEVDIMYRVNGYPTMYVVDRNGKIAYAEIGFSEESFGKLVEKVRQLLRELYVDHPYLSNMDNNKL